MPEEGGVDTTVRRRLHTHSLYRWKWSSQYAHPPHHTGFPRALVACCMCYELHRMPLLESGLVVSWESILRGNGEDEDEDMERNGIPVYQ